MSIESQLGDLSLNEREPIKKKKGRPRKEQLVPSDAPQEEKKKRGRKKKPVVEEEVKQKKKRGRKAAVKYFSSSIRKKIPLTTIVEDSNNYILHLDVKEEDAVGDSITKVQVNDDMTSMVEKFNEEYSLGDDIKVEDLINEAEYAEISSHVDLNELYEQRLEYRDTQDQFLKTHLEGLRRTNDTNDVDQEGVRKDVQDKKRKKGYFEVYYDLLHNKDWLDKTDISCWWCCHGFDTVPLGLPVQFLSQHGKFRVRGVFCSFPCLVSYKNELKLHKYEYLIKYLFKKITGDFATKNDMKPAPPRCALKMFGGELTIDEFRASFTNHKIYKMVEYPMFISRDYVEEVDIVDLKNINTQVFKEHDASISTVRLDQKKVEEAKSRLSQYEHITRTSGNTIDKFLEIS